MQTILHCTITCRRFGDVVETTYDSVKQMMKNMRYWSIVINSVEKVEPFSRCLGCGTKVAVNAARCWPDC